MPRYLISLFRLISVSQHCSVISKCCWSHQQHSNRIADHAAPNKPTQRFRMWTVSINWRINYKRQLHWEVRAIYDLSCAIWDKAKSHSGCTKTRTKHIQYKQKWSQILGYQTEKYSWDISNKKVYILKLDLNLAWHRNRSVYFQDISLL